MTSGGINFPKIVYDFLKNTKYKKLATQRQFQVAVQMLALWPRLTAFIFRTRITFVRKIILFRALRICLRHLIWK